VKTRIKIISSSKLTTLEEEINTFLEENEISVVNLTISNTEYLVFASLVYTLDHNETTA